MFNLVWLIPLLPLIGFLIIGLGNKKLSNTLVSIIGCGVILGSFLIVLSLLIPFLQGTAQPQVIKMYDWMATGRFNISFSFLIDPLSVWMMTIITGVGFLIHVYSAGYMSHDEGFARYFSYLNLFVFSMLLLVMGSNYLVLFAGWEGVGLCSYLLIGFWFKNTEYNNAAKKAFIMNRIGDLGFLLGMFLIFMTFGTLEFEGVFRQVSDPATSIIKPEAGVIIAITLLLFIGATGKSAQIPLYTWLPDAMAGPTPVSALIHAATMVTAGIYLIVRSNALFGLAHFTMEIIEVVGLATALFAATIALVQNDIKKVLAYSTVSQLGFMFFALGLGAYSTAMFHLTTHAFFKALLFLGAGSVIHAMSGEQDMRMMGGLSKKLPITFATILIGTLAISGIPPLSGFFSKDEILAHAFHHAPFLWGIALVGALMTCFYMFRMVFLTFFGNFRGTEEKRSHLHESPLVMTIPLMILAVLSAVGGIIGLPQNNFIENFLKPLIVRSPDAHEFSNMLVGISTGAIIVTIIISYIVYVRKGSVPAKEGIEQGVAHKVLYNKYYIDEIYNFTIVKPVKWLSLKFHTILEIRIIDNFVNAWGKGLNLGSSTLRLIQNGSISYYLLMMVAGIIIILFVNSLI
jgi:NADH-quinone oxidoreductase subunit L